MLTRGRVERALVGSHGGIGKRVGIVDLLGDEIHEPTSDGLVGRPRGCHDMHATVALTEEIDAHALGHDHEPCRELCPGVLDVLP